MSRSLRVEPYTDEKRSEWSDFVAGANNGTIFHDLDFLSYHPPDRFSEHHLMFFQGEKLIGIAPMAVVESEGRTIARSPYGGSWGGIAHSEGQFHVVFNLVAQWVAYVRDLGVQEIQVVPPPVVYHQQADYHLDFALLKHGFALTDRQLTSVIPLMGASVDPLALLSGPARRNVRRAIGSGVQVEISQDYQSFYQILRQTIEEKHGSRITHSYAELLRLRGLIGDRMVLYLANYERHAVAGVLCFVANQRCLLAFYNCFLEAYQALRPLNLVFFQIIKDALACEYNYVDLGTTSGLHEQIAYGLFRFKESLGGRGYFRDYYALTFQ